MRELDIKVVCVGAANTGKTTFLRYWETGEPPLHLSTTIQMEFHRREMTIAVPLPGPFEQKNQRSEEDVSLTAGTTTAAENERPGNGQRPHGDSVNSSLRSYGLRRHRTSNVKHLSFASMGSESSTNGSSSVSHMLLHNPFGSGYNIVPPRLPSSDSMTVATDSNTGKRIYPALNDNDVEKEEKCPLIHVPAVVKVWDIQGQESTKKMTRIFYTGAIAVLIFCEMGNSIDSLTSALSWKSDVEQKIHITKEKSSLMSAAPTLPPGGCGANGIRPSNTPIEEIESENPPCWLVVNKYDLLSGLPSPPQWASHAALDELCARHGFAGWSYAVGRRGVNVEAVVRAVISAAVERFPHKFTWTWEKETVHASPGGGGGGDSVVLRTRRQLQQRQKTGCCSK